MVFLLTKFCRGLIVAFFHISVMHLLQMLFQEMGCSWWFQGDEARITLARFTPQDLTLVDTLAWASRKKSVASH
jgi:hypothetical protein